MKAKRRQPSGIRFPVKNDIRRALLNAEYKHLSPQLEQVRLKRGEIIHQAEQRIDHVYFPETAVVPMIATVEDGGTVEVGIIGHEGMVGINICLGCLVTPDKTIVQISGSAMRMKTSDLRKELRFGSPLQRLLVRYTQTLLAIISQSVACSRHHTMGQRLARWLLTMHDHAESNEFEMPHVSIAALLGARREGGYRGGREAPGGRFDHLPTRSHKDSRRGRVEKEVLRVLSVCQIAVRRVAA